MLKAFDCSLWLQTPWCEHLELLSLEKVSLQGDLLVLIQYLNEACKKDGGTF